MSNKSDSDWKIPVRRSQRIKQRNPSEFEEPALKLSNRFEFKDRSMEGIDKRPKEPAVTQHQAVRSKKVNSDIVQNLSDAKISIAEQSVLEKGLNFCPTSKFPSRIKLLDDLYFFCRKLRLKEYFYSPDEESTADTSEEEQEKCDLNTRIANPFFNPSKSPSNVLSTYMSAVKKDVARTLKSPNMHRSNLTIEEREALKNLSSNTNITVKPADKGGKVVVMNQTDYIAECEKNLSDGCFYRKLEEDPNASYAEEVNLQAKKLLDNSMITEKEFKFVTKDTEEPRTPIFYGLPKVHKLFKVFPPLRPIVSHVGSCTHRLSEFLDAYLKFQARLSSSFVRDTKQFLQKIEAIKAQGIPDGSILVTMDVTSLYTNIDHEEGAEACYQKLEQRKKKTIPSAVLKTLILLVLKSNAFRFGKTIYHQIMGTAMGTPMAPNYANIFMTKFETDLINSYYQKEGIRPLVWFRYIDDIFFIWTDGPEKLSDFIKHAQNFSESTKMKSKIKFDVNQSTEKVNFLDVVVKLQRGVLVTSLYSKPTDAHMYLYTSSNHPKHVIKNIPKGQFIRIRRICSDMNDYKINSNILSEFLMKRGYCRKELAKVINDVAEMKRDVLLIDEQKAEKDPQTIFVSEWHPCLSKLPSVLKKHFHLLESDQELAKIFPTPPSVAFRRPKSLRNHLIRSQLSMSPKDEAGTCTFKCGRCKICKSLASSKEISNPKVENTTEKIMNYGTCSSRNLIYAVRCKKCNCLYIGQTGEKGLRTTNWRSIFIAIMTRREIWKFSYCKQD